MTGATKLTARRAFNPAETSGIFGVSRSTIYRWIEDGTLRTVKIGQRRFVTQAEINRLLGLGEG